MSKTTNKKTGPLSNAEKLKIQELMSEGRSDDDITKLLDRKSITPVKNYRKKFEDQWGPSNSENDSLDLQRELDDLKLKLAEAIALDPDDSEEEGEGVQFLDEAIVGTIHKLKQYQVKEEDAKAALRFLQRKLTERIDDPDRLTALCLQQLRAKNAMVTKTAGENEGVAVMTGAASAIIEEKSKHRKPVVSRTARSCIVESKTGKMR